MKKTLLLFLSMTCMLSISNAQDINVLDFDGVTPTFTGSDTVRVIANPEKNGINASANVGRLTHVAQYNDANTSVDIDPRVYNSIEMMVYSPYSTTGKVTIACLDAAGNQLDWYESSAITTAGVWTKVTRNLSFTTKVASVKIGFNRNDVPSTTANDNMVYFDNLIFKKNTSPFFTLYCETFAASWSQWGSWSGAPSTKAGSWFGKVNLQTEADAVINLDRWWDAYEHVLKINSTDAAVVIPDINVAGFDSLKVAFDSHDEAGKPVIDVKVGSGNWVSIPTTQSWSWSWKNFVLLLKDAAGNPINNVSTISLKLSPSAAGVVILDNVKIIGKVTSNANGLTTQSLTKFAVYPNPAQNYILTPNAQKVMITDLNGRVVKNMNNAEKVDVSSLAKGLYLVKIQCNNLDKVGTFIKK
ncbi:MAG TPA: T9SS type A sorting domain-containing protein [Bacteroidales bacterium]|nr:T9SS type A sorting domain-containing protein [Bacteroidales bacterium]